MSIALITYKIPRVLGTKYIFLIINHISQEQDLLSTNNTLGIRLVTEDKAVTQTDTVSFSKELRALRRRQTSLNVSVTTTRVIPFKLKSVGHP